MRFSCVGRRPAVSARTTSMPFARADWMASKMMAAESPPSCETTVTPWRAPQDCSCSRAAARKVSPAASSTESPCDWKARELADGGGLARAVHAGQQDHEGLRSRGGERLLERGEEGPRAPRSSASSCAPSSRRLSRRPGAGSRSGARSHARPRRRRAAGPPAPRRATRRSTGATEDPATFFRRSPVSASPRFRRISSRTRERRPVSWIRGEHGLRPGAPRGEESRIFYGMIARDDRRGAASRAKRSPAGPARGESPSHRRGLWRSRVVRFPTPTGFAQRPIACARRSSNWLGQRLPGLVCWISSPAAGRSASRRNRAGPPAWSSSSVTGRCASSSGARRRNWAPGRASKSCRPMYLPGWPAPASATMSPSSTRPTRRTRGAGARRARAEAQPGGAGLRGGAHGPRGPVAEVEEVARGRRGSGEVRALRIRRRGRRSGR